MKAVETLAVERPVDPRWKVSSPFGPRVRDGKTEMHNGVDFAVPLGTPVYAMVDGKIFKSGFENPSDPKQGFGLRLWQTATLNGVTYWVWYGHLSEISVVGGLIKAGQHIGFSGNSGLTTGPHLHVQAKNTKTSEFCNLQFGG